LLIQALAGEVKRFHRAAGPISSVAQGNPRFDPTQCPHVQEAMDTCLEYAGCADVSARSQHVLRTVRRLSNAAAYDALAAVLVGNDKPFPNERLLDAALTDLEDRGLLGWDKRANRYDLHPIVRNVVWVGWAKARGMACLCAARAL